MGVKIIRGGLTRLTEKITPDLQLFQDIFSKWNSYQQNIVNVVNIVSNVNSVNIVRKIDDIDAIDDITHIYVTINNSNLSGRDLELFFPLFIIADMIGEGLLEKIIIIAKQLSETKAQRDREENKDVLLLDFLSQQEYIGFVNVSVLVEDFKQFVDDESLFITSNSMSRALNRLNLIIDRKSTGKARQVKINIDKAKQKLLCFKVSPPNSVSSYSPNNEKSIADFSSTKIKEQIEKDKPENG